MAANDQDTPSLPTEFTYQGNITLYGNLQGGIIGVGHGIKIETHYHFERERDPSAILTGESAIPQGPPFDEALLFPPEHFVGRVTELNWLLKRLRLGGTTAITALRGMGGIGKTALAAVALRKLREEGRFKDGIAIILCQGKTDAIIVLQEVLTAFDPFRRPPESSEFPRLAEIAHQLLDRRNTLIVLDSVEPALAVEMVVAPLRATGATILLTARHKLPANTVPPEGNWELALLSPSEALTLLAHSLGYEDATNLSPEDRVSAEQIIAALGGHTLAVKLAGAYAADLNRDLAALASELANPQRALELPEDETPEAIQRVFAQSLQALPNTTQRLFIALAAFPTTEFGRHAALAFAKTVQIDQPEYHLNLLVRRALIDASLNKRLPPSNLRERLHQHTLLRAFAARMFTRWIEQTRFSLQLAVADYYVWYANEVPDPLLEIDERNITGVLEWAHEQEIHGQVAALCRGIQRYWSFHWFLAKCLRYLPWGIEAAEKVAEETNDLQAHKVTAHIISVYAGALERRGRLSQAEEYFKRALVIDRRVEDYHGESDDLAGLGRLAMARDRQEEAKTYFLKAFDAAHKAQYFFGQANAFGALGTIALQRDLLEEAENFILAALVIARQLQNHQMEGAILCLLGQLAYARKQMVEAEKYLSWSLTLVREARDRHSEAGALAYLGFVAQARGQLDKAVDYYQQALTITREIQDWQTAQKVASILVVLEIGRENKQIQQKRQAFKDWRTESEIRNQQGLRQKYIGYWGRAEAHFQESLAICRQQQDTHGEGVALTLLGETAWHRGFLEEADTYFQQALIIAHEEDDTANEQDILNALEDLAKLHGQSSEIEVQPQEIDPEAVAVALNAFLNTHSWEESHFVLARQRRLLLTDVADQLLANTIAQISQSNDSSQHEQISHLKQHDALLQAAQAEGIIFGWVTFLYALQARQWEEQRILHQSGNETPARELGIPTAWAEFEATLQMSYQREQGALLGGELSKDRWESIIQALSLFLNASSWQEMHTLLKKMNVLLLTETAERVLSSFIAQLLKSRDSQRSERADYVDTLRTLLHKAQLVGIPAAWSEFEYVHLTTRLQQESSSGDKRQTLDTLSDLGRLVRKLGRKEEAMRYCQQMLTIAGEVGDRYKEAVALNNLGDVVGDLGHTQEAERYYQQALVIWSELGDQLGKGATLNNLGGLALDLGLQEEAMHYFEQALAINRELEDRTQEGITLNNLGYLAHQLERKEEAKRYYQQSLIIRHEAGDQGGEATTLNNLGSLASNLGQGEEAMRYYEQSLAIDRQLDNREQEGNCLNNLGHLAANLGDEEKAIRYFEQALAVWHELGNRAREGVTLNNLGYLAYQLEREEEATRYFEQVLIIKREVGDRGGEGVTLYNLGGSAAVLGHKEKAVHYFEQALVILHESGDQAVEFEVLLHLGSLANDLGDNEEAKRYYQQALVIARETGNQGGEGASLTNLGRIARFTGNLQEAVRYFEEGLALFQEVGDRRGEAATISNMGRLALDLGNLEEAARYFMQTLDIAHEIGDRAGEGTALHNLGHMSQDQKHIEEAVRYYEQALAIFEEVGAADSAQSVRENLLALRNES